MFRRILLWFSGLLVFSFLAFLVTSYLLAPHPPSRDRMFRRLAVYHGEEAARTFEERGREGLARFLDRLDRFFPSRHYLVDRKGRDLVTGEDRRELLERQIGRPAIYVPFLPMPPPKGYVTRHEAAGGRYIFLLESESPFDLWANLPVYLWIVAVIVLLCYALAWTLAKPVRQLRETVVRFGKGDLTSRAGSRRKDELGDLARAFDQMADRIEMLLTAERRLLADVSHELRSPLARLRFALELARTNPDSEEAFSRVNREVDRMAALVGELLQVTRAEGDPESRNLEEVAIEPFLGGIVSGCAIEAEARGCSIRWTVAPGLCSTADRELLHRAVENVLRNAIQHAPAGSAVELDARRDGAETVVAIRDRGPGVPEADLERIFRPFFRVEEDRSRVSGTNGGVGLGLAIAARAVRVHNGSIRARNVEPGLLVELRLPA